MKPGHSSIRYQRDASSFLLLCSEFWLHQNNYLLSPGPVYTPVPEDVAWSIRRTVVHLMNLPSFMGFCCNLPRESLEPGHPFSVFRRQLFVFLRSTLVQWKTGESFAVAGNYLDRCFCSVLLKLRLSTPILPVGVHRVWMDPSLHAGHPHLAGFHPPLGCTIRPPGESGDDFSRSTWERHSRLHPPGQSPRDHEDCADKTFIGRFSF